MRDYITEFQKDIDDFCKATNDFYQKKITVAEYKRLSGKFGSYAQRGGAYGMLRLRLCGGRITKDQLRFIVDSINKYQIDRIHFTTCQTVQLHNLKPDNICQLIEEAWKYGIITLGGGGDFPRNVMVSPLSCVQAEEPFDLNPYADAAADYLLSTIPAVKLPRKLKVCFSNTIEDFPHATFRDLGFVAKENHTFDVYSAGGLGRDPKMGVLVAENAAPEMTLYFVKAMLDTFTTYGNYENRGKSRTRFMQDTLGQEGYRKAYQEKLAAALASEDLTIAVSPTPSKKTGDGTLSHPRAIAQKQPGLYAVSYHPIGGCPTPDMLRAILQTIDPMQDVALRLAPDEGMYFINCTAREAEALIAQTDDGAQNAFEASVACIGNHICQLGLRDSQALLKACVDAVRPLGFADGVLPKIHISGCPSSCGSHQVGALGFRGAVKQTPEGPKAAYALFEGGCDVLGQEQFGTELGVMKEENIPAFFAALGQAVSQTALSYEDWIQENRDVFLKLVEQYTAA